MMQIIKPGTTVCILKPGNDDWIKGYVDSVEICMNGALIYHCKAWSGNDLKDYSLPEELIQTDQHIQRPTVGFKNTDKEGFTPTKPCKRCNKEMVTSNLRMYYCPDVECGYREDRDIIGTGISPEGKEITYGLDIAHGDSIGIEMGIKMKEGVPQYFTPRENITEVERTMYHEALPKIIQDSGPIRKQTAGELGKCEGCGEELHMNRITCKNPNCTYVWSGDQRVSKEVYVTNECIEQVNPKLLQEMKEAGYKFKVKGPSGIENVDSDSLEPIPEENRIEEGYPTESPAPLGSLALNKEIHDKLKDNTCPKCGSSLRETRLGTICTNIDCDYMRDVK